MTQTQIHTPTPYRINDNDKRQVITGDRTGVIATCQSRENAAFIVKACNSHDALVEILGHMLARSEAATATARHLAKAGIDSKANAAWADEQEFFNNAAKRALAQAEGKRHD